MTSPLATLQTAERAVVSQINTVADAVSTVATTALDTAMERLRGEVSAAQSRIQAAMQEAVGSVMDLAQSLLSITCADSCGIEEFVLLETAKHTTIVLHDPSSVPVQEVTHQAVQVEEETTSIAACGPVGDNETALTESADSSGIRKRKRAPRKKAVAEPLT